MSFKRFQQISRALRFNDELSKTQGCDDKLADIRKVWDMWTSRLPMLFNPDRDVCVDKLFIPFKGRCSFRQYMPNAYTGKEAGDCAEVNQGMSLVLDMTEELKGHVVTCDKYFTSFTLADELLRRNLALVGAIRKGNPELPRHLLQARERAVFSSTFAFTETHTLVSYIQRRGKNVLLLSTKHHHPDIGDEKKGKPVIVKDYNKCKGSVNNLDKALDTYSCRRKTKCWPLALFYSLVDISLYNAYVLWTFDPSWQPNWKPYKQRLYIEEVGETLVTPHIKKRGRLPRSSAAAGIVANLRDAAPPLIGKYNQAASSTPSKAAAPGARPKGSVIDLTEDDDDVQVTGVKNATVAPIARPNPVISIPNSAGARSSPQSNQTSPNNPQLTVHHRPQQDSSLKSRTVTTSSTPTRGSNMALPPLPTAPAPPRLPPEAERSSPPQQPQLKLVPSQTGIVLSWCVAETDRTCAAVDSYHLYAFHQDNSNSNAAQQHWKKIGEVKALPLPMACTLTQFQSGSTYHFAVRAKDIYGRFGSFCEPQCTNVISSTSS
ncbi:Activating transcription factor 7-interacting protein 1 [Larimichthys crocea]|uniref:Activating transcription factor 7-interacting protein 1 n=1 Tax=Larimichthys crocea TaxID=215358 RepID=A0A6G0J9C5_LARCR|nr:Activating transcription factor 7-interacting protein 1 [Larimichthys crocea]